MRTLLVVGLLAVFLAVPAGRRPGTVEAQGGRGRRQLLRACRRRPNGHRGSQRHGGVGVGGAQPPQRDGHARFASRTKRSGSYRKKLARRGSYKILCTIHAPGMRMTLRVE